MAKKLVRKDRYSHSRHGGYQEMAHNVPRDWKSAYPLVDGLPQVPYPGAGPQFNPSTISAYGLANWSIWYRHGDKAPLVNAKRAADWLVNNQKKSGKWTYGFDYTPAGSQQPLQSGWSSALAQGQAMSLLGRAYNRWKDPKYLDAIHRALVPMRTSVPNKGLARWHNGGIYFEEYPTAQKNFVLNGNLQALLGLYDVSDISPVARSLFDRGVQTAARSVGEFDEPGQHRSFYSQASHMAPPVSYNPLIRDQLRDLSNVTGRQIFRRYANRWSAP